MYELRLFKPSDAKQLSIQPTQVIDQSLFDDWSDEKWESVGFHLNPSVTGLRNDEIIVCAGVIPQWPGRAVSWALLGSSIGPRDMLWVHRQARWFIEDQLRNFHRIEGHVHEPFEAGHRWMRMLGFVSEGVMRRYDPEGRDMRLYARIA